MTPERWRRLDELFSAALERADGDRAVFLDSECGDDPCLRSEVERLLQNHERAPRFLEPPSLGGRDAPPAPPPDRIGQYRIIRLIAAGGMGAVYEAEQDRPRRAVALKIARSALASPWAFQRFRHEAEILARLRHPGIAQVYEAGTHTPAPGAPPQPYFAMEYVEGAKTITEFAAAQALSLDQKFRLFTRVCNAVQHGHRLGIVHRDLKPANILVDADGNPKVIDFGLARAVGADEGATAETAPGQIVGTPAYMSPEHLAGDPHDIDTRADVYALGVVLFELVCGAPPYDVRGKPLAEAARIIQHEPPRRPADLTHHARGDPATIILKSLEKDRDRRYQSADDLARDIERFLRHEPILARPPSLTYRARKFIRRRRVPVAAAAIAAAALLAGGAVSIAFAWREARTARQELRQRQIATELAVMLDNALAAADPGAAEPDLSVRELLNRTAAALDARPPGADPEIEASVRTRLGQSYVGLGAGQEARTQFEAAVAACERAGKPASPQMYAALRGLTRACLIVPDPAAALAAGERAAELARAMHGEESEEFAACIAAMSAAMSMLRRYDEGTVLAERSLGIRERLHGPESPALADSLLAVATIAQRQRRYEEAEALLRRALELRRRDAGDAAGQIRLARSLGNLSVVLVNTGKHEEAESLQRESIALLSGRVRPDHIRMMIERRRLGLTLERRGDAPGAEEVFRASHDAYAASANPDVQLLAAAKDDLARALLKQQRDHEAEPLLRESVRLRGGTPLAREPDAVASMEQWGAALLRLGRPAEARPPLETALDIRAETLGPRDPRTLAAQSSLGECLMELGERVEAGRLLLKSYAGLKEAVGEDDQRTRDALARLERLRAGDQRAGER